MKRVLLIIFVLLLAGAAILAWLVMGPTTRFNGKYKYVYIKTDQANKASILQTLQEDSLVKNTAYFSLLADRMHYWSSIKPGRYRINRGESLLTIVRKLRNGSQSPVDFTIVKFRTPSDLARAFGRKLEIDSADIMAYITDSAVVQDLGVDTNTIMTLVIPDTYTYFWDARPNTIFSKLKAAAERFWTAARKQQADSLGLTPVQVYTLASIVEEETNAKSDKPNVSSVYLNRIKKGMPLQADPTVKFAMRNFGLKRIYYNNLRFDSPYNTYLNKGLPPGPICTPSKETLNAVLNTPDTDYLYFVANSDFSGTHIFTSNFNDHKKYAQLFRQAQNHQDSIRKGLLPNK